MIVNISSFICVNKREVLVLSCAAEKLMLNQHNAKVWQLWIGCPLTAQTHKRLRSSDICEVCICTMYVSAQWVQTSKCKLVIEAETPAAFEIGTMISIQSPNSCFVARITTKNGHNLLPTTSMMKTYCCDSTDRKGLAKQQFQFDSYLRVNAAEKKQWCESTCLYITAKGQTLR